MKLRIRLPHIRLPRIAWHRRAPRPERQPVTAASPAGILGGMRAAALSLVATLVISASAVSFAESYRGLYLWARNHGLAGIWAAGWPVQVDVFIGVGELALFVALVDQWRTRQRAAGWVVTVFGLAVSVAGNIGHVAGHSLTVRATAAVPPLAAASALAVGLGVLKRVVGKRHAQTVTDALPPPPDGDQDAPAAAPHAEILARLGEVLTAVRVIGAGHGDAPWAAVPDDSQSAAVIALRASAIAGNPLSGRQLETRFGLTRAQVTKVRELVLAGTNGHHTEDSKDSADL